VAVPGGHGGGDSDGTGKRKQQETGQSGGKSKAHRVDAHRDDAGACDVCGQMRPVGVVLERQLEDLRAAREKARRRLARVKEGDNVLGPVMESFGCD
jgi:hypothetical protein